MIQARCLRESPLERSNVLGMDSQCRLLNSTRLPDDERSVPVVSERAKKCLRNFAITLVVARRKVSLMHNHSTHGSVITPDCAFDHASHIIGMSSVSRGAILIVIAE
jgi:hypothetical protein